jgi:myo-inositol-1(or 4)-monophosphatase
LPGPESQDESPAGRESDRRLIEEATRAAGALVSGFIGGVIANWMKSPGEVVTEADLASDKLLQETLLGARPDYGWLSEERADDPVRLGKSHVWVVDPIDGTRDFVNGRAGFAVSVALVVDGQPVLAALDAPARGEFYLAERGRGATLNGRPIRVSGREHIEGCRIPMDPGLLASKRWGAPWKGVAVDKPNGLALRVAMVASGEADFFVQPLRVAQWDIAAAALILEEAGGRVSDGEGRPLAFNRPETRFSGLIATTPALYDDAKEQLDRLRRPSRA